MSDLTNLMKEVIVGLKDETVKPATANAINGSVSQLVKIIKLEIQHGEAVDGHLSMADSKPKTITSELSAQEDIRQVVFDHVSSNGPASFRDVGNALGLRWQAIRDISDHDLFSVAGNEISVAS